MARSLVQYRHDLIDDGRLQRNGVDGEGKAVRYAAAVSGGIGGNGGQGVDAIRQRAGHRQRPVPVSSTVATPKTLLPL